MRVVLAALLLVGCGQAPVGQLDSLVAFLRDVHPEPHRHVAAAELDALVAAEQSELGDAPDALALAAATQRVVAALGDAHLVAGLAADGSRREGFPLQAVRAGDLIFVDASEPALPVGTELVSVEGRPADAFLRDLSRYASIDGDRPAVRLAEAERRFAGFATLELGRRERYAVEVRRPGEGVTALTLTASSVDLDARRASAPRWGRSDAAPWPSVHAHDAWTILRLPGFGVPDEEGYAAAPRALRRRRGRGRPRLALRDHLVPFSGCEPGRGVVPDVEVRYERAHFLEARDPFLEALGRLPTGRSDR